MFGHTHNPGILHGVDTLGGKPLYQARQRRKGGDAIPLRLLPSQAFLYFSLAKLCCKPVQSVDASGDV